MDEKVILNNFQELLEKDPDISASVAAITILVELVDSSNAETLSGLVDTIKQATKVMLSTDESYTCISAGCDQFLRYITLANLHGDHFQKIVLQRAKAFLSNVQKARDKAVKVSQQFIADGTTILTHSRSRVVLQALKEAAMTKKKRFTVYVTESHPDRSGYDVRDELRKVGIPTTVILDAAIGVVMEKAKLVLVGAEGIVESGGIINKIGTYPLAVCAKEMKKPLYVIAESFKFVRAFPLNQEDVPDEYRYPSSTLRRQENMGDVHPLTDYTPPEFIDLLFTDLGVVPPSAVSEELIKRYC